MYKVLAPMTAAMLALSPLVVSADQNVRLLDTTKSSGNVSPAVGDNVVSDDVLVTGGGLNTAALIGLGLVGAIVIAVVATSDGGDGSSSTTTVVED